MKARAVTVPELMLIGGTRVALGAGLGLLIGDRLTPDARRAAGCALLAVGALSSIPLLLGVLGKPAIANDPDKAAGRV
jgi:sorbitol-specific phosphotransferase system component IIBC